MKRLRVILKKLTQAYIMLLVFFAQSSFATDSIETQIDSLITYHLTSVEQFKINIDLQQAGQLTEQTYFNPSSFKISDQGEIYIGAKTYKLKGILIEPLPQQIDLEINDSYLPLAQSNKAITKDSRSSIAAINSTRNGTVQSTKTSSAPAPSSISLHQQREPASKSKPLKQNKSPTSTSSPSVVANASQGSNTQSSSYQKTLDDLSDTTILDDTIHPTDNNGGGTNNIDLPTIIATKTGYTESANFISTELPIDAQPDQLYIASIAHVDNEISIITVDGLGLNWIKVQDQCGINDELNMEVWYAVGSPLASDTITATFSEEVETAIIGTMQITNFNLQNPLGAITTHNNNGTGLDALCGQGNNSKEYNTTISTTEDSSLIISFVAFDKNTNGNITASGTEQYAVLTGSAENKLQSAATSYHAKETGEYDVSGEFEISAIWSQIVIEINPQL